MSPQTGKRPGAGAPKKDELRTEQIRVLFTPSEKARIVAAWGIRPGPRCRAAILAAAPKHTAAITPIAAYRSAVAALLDEAGILPLPTVFAFYGDEQHGGDIIVDTVHIASVGVDEAGLPIIVWSVAR